MKTLVLILFTITMNAQVVIVLDKKNVHWLDSVHQIDSAYLVEHNHVDFKCIQARDSNVFFLPLAVLTDSNFTITRNRIYGAGLQDSIIIKQVDTSFFILPKKSPY